MKQLILDRQDKIRIITTDTTFGSNVTHQNSSALDMKTMAT